MYRININRESKLTSCCFKIHENQKKSKIYTNKRHSSYVHDNHAKDVFTRVRGKWNTIPD